MQKLGIFYVRATAEVLGGSSSIIPQQNRLLNALSWSSWTLLRAGLSSASPVAVLRQLWSS